ncbi:phenazine biosynthesis protein PhzF family [Halovivax ruber XH-70]|uniref:Phenazine biosynthesis protein PhzF family n=1 Tax=Halovivax ruber (strain DSM 18193 / JCM 13892 / XH-70) TaxID=797302 RepID=L0IA03_HALRX|nr:PhzF family phenazine biosynthesis protein [Halovivax ruber]AGB15554.1 phenazine biosynthesis protein PhzF family [Halovivax ruber XH-70]
MNNGTLTASVRLVDAFTDEPLAGNPAGVVFEADELVDEQRQAIANELSVSETAFASESDDADYRLQYFTPTQEVDLCGHATIGTLVAAHETGRLEPGTATIETNVGVLDVDIEPDGTAWMTQDAPTIREVDLGYDRVAEALGVEVAALEGVGADLPLAVSSTGLPFLMVPITYLQDVGGADPDMAEIETLADEFDATGIYLFTFDALEADSTVHGRMFAPGAGVPEDPVTGTASGAVGAYLRRFGAFSGDTGGTVTAGTGGDTSVAVSIDESAPTELVMEQGHYVDRPGRVRVRVDGDVRVGGHGIVSMTGELAVPSVAEDDIIEP